MESTQCKAWIYAEDDANGALTHGHDQLQSFGLPLISWILSNDGQGRYPYDKTYAEAARDVITIIHTSGTTGKLVTLTTRLAETRAGIPKAINHTNGMWSAMGSLPDMSQRHWPRGIAHDGWIGQTALNCCAPRWLAGMHTMIISPVFMNSPCIMLPPDVDSPTPDLFRKVMEVNLVDGETETYRKSDMSTC